MTSYNLVNGEHVSESHRLVSDVLYNEFHFEGITMTDWTINHAVGVVDRRSVYPGAYADAVAAAGVTLFMPGGRKDYKELQNGLKNNTVSRKQLEENITRLYKNANKLKDITE